MNYKKYNKIFAIYSLHFPFAIILLLVLNFAFGTSCGDVSIRPLGEMSDIIGFLILFFYSILMIVHFVFLCLAERKSKYLIMTLLNFIHCLIFAWLPSTILVFAFGFIIAAPVMLILGIFWLSTWVTLSSEYKSIDKEESQEVKRSNISYCLLPFLLICFMIATTYSIYDLYGLNRAYSAIMSDVPRFHIQYLNPVWHAQEKERKEVARKFYEAVKEIEIVPNKMTYDEIFQKYQEDLQNQEKYKEVFGKYDNIDTKIERIRECSDKCRYSDRHYFNIMVISDTKEKYSLYLYEEKNDEYKWRINYRAEFTISSNGIISDLRIYGSTFL